MKRPLLFLLASVLTLHAQVTLVKDKTPLADIVFSAQSEKAAQSLNDYLYKSAGTRLPIIKKPGTFPIGAFTPTIAVDERVSLAL